MKKSQFSEEQIIGILREAEGDTPIKCHRRKSSRRMATFEQLFPTFLKKCAELHELLRIVAFMLFVVGTILQVLHGFTGKTPILHMVRLFV